MILLTTVLLPVAADAGRVRAAGASAGITGRGAPPAPLGASAAPRATLLYALRCQPGTIRLGARTQRDIRQV